MIGYRPACIITLCRCPYSQLGTSKCRYDASGRPHTGPWSLQSPSTVALILGNALEALQWPLHGLKNSLRAFLLRLPIAFECFSVFAFVQQVVAFHESGLAVMQALPADVVPTWKGVHFEMAFKGVQQYFNIISRARSAFHL